jgi:hypothetical protein
VTNPWKAPMFTSAFDFLPDGRAVISTFHGDVFIASGIDDKLEKVTWRRFASPDSIIALGLKVVNGEMLRHLPRRPLEAARHGRRRRVRHAMTAFNFELTGHQELPRVRTFDLQADATPATSTSSRPVLFARAAAASTRSATTTALS